MTPNKLWYQTGQFDRCIDDKHTDLGKRIFAVVYQQDPVYVLQKLAFIKKQPGVPAIWEERLKVMLSAVSLVNNRLKDAIEIFNTIKGAVLTGHKDHWSSFYISTYRFLYQLYSADDLLRQRDLKATTCTLIGDSHTLGVSGVAGTELQRFYLPGIVLRGLANPSNNNFKQAIHNAVNMAYATDRVVFSVGEIDSRGLVGKLATDPEHWYKIEPRWQATIDSAYAFLASLRNPMQEFGIVIPPAASENVVKPHLANMDDPSEFTQLCADVTKAFRMMCREAAQKHGLLPVEYPTSIETDQGLSTSDALLDHAHFTLDTYRQLVDSVLS